MSFIKPKEQKEESNSTTSQLTPPQELEKFLQEKGYILTVVPQFSLGDDGRLIYKARISVDKKGS